MIGSRQRSHFRSVEIYVDPENETADQIKSKEKGLDSEQVRRVRRATLEDRTNKVEPENEIVGLKVKEKNVGSDTVGKRAALGIITNVTSTRSESSKSSKGFRHSTPVSKEDNVSISTTVKEVSASKAFFNIYQDESTICPNEEEAVTVEIPAISEPKIIEVANTLGVSHASETDCLRSDKNGITQPAKVTDQPQSEIPDEARIILSPNIAESFNHFESIIRLEELRLERLLRRHQDRVFCVTEYAWDIYEYLREAEMRNRPRLRHFSRQPYVTANMRAILVDWLVDVADEYNLHRESVFLAVNYIDRFLSLMSVVKDKLQLVGITCLFLAAKYEEIRIPSIEDFVDICDNTYTKNEIVRMEKGLLQTLSFEICVPTANAFCEKILKESGSSDETCSMAMFVLELTLLDVQLSMSCLPSILACACICVANYALALPVWPTELIDITEYLIGDFLDCFVYTYRIYAQSAYQPADKQTTRNKYLQPKYHCVAALKPRRVPFEVISEISGTTPEN